MSPLRRVKGKMVPNSVHDMRVKNWQKIRAQEQMRGDGLKRVLAIDRIVKTYNKLKSSGNLGKRLHGQAKAIDIMLTRLADEYFLNLGRQNVPNTEWNQVYLKFFWTARKQMPKELRKEIFRQIREE